MKLLEKRNVKSGIKDNILEIVLEKSKVPLSSDKMKKHVGLENLMIRAYLEDPMMNYASCRKAVQPDLEGMFLDDGIIRRRAEEMKLSERSTRSALSEWAGEVVEKIYEGMAGSKEALTEAVDMVAGRYSSDERYHFAQEQFVLHGMFERIPQLRESEGRNAILKLGRRYCKICLSLILNSIEYDISSHDEEDTMELITDPTQLRREIYLARKELSDYRELVAAADAEFEDKLEELKQQEIVSFFSSLNNEKYGFLIDSLYLQKMACDEIRKSGEKIPYLLDGIPPFLTNLLGFLIDSGISPASRFAPHSTQYLTLEMMVGCRFEPLPERTEPIKEGEVVKVKVVSAGWKYGNSVISYPILQEDYSN